MTSFGFVHSSFIWMSCQKIRLNGSVEPRRSEHSTRKSKRRYVCVHMYVVVIYVSSVGFETRSWLFVLNCSTLQTLAKLQASRTWWWTTHSHRMRGWENMQFSKTIRMDGSVHYGLININFFCLCVFLFQSLWNKFFQDKELRGMIKQDVLRT